MATLKELSDAASPGAWYTVDTPWGDGTWIVAGSPDPHAGTMVCDCEDLNETRPDDGPDAADDAAFIAALVTAYRSGQLARASDAEHYMRLTLEKAERIQKLSDELDLARDCLKRGDERDAEYVQLRAENARLREEWAQEGIGWLRDKDIDRLMAVEDENKLLRERLEDKTNSLRVEIAAKQGAHNEIKILETALRRAVRALDEEQAIQPESQIHHDLKDALP